MNRIIKISLLAAAIFMAVGWMMYFLKSSVSPPMKMDMSIAYLETARADVETAVKTETIGSMDSSFAAITHEITFLHTNQLITDDEYKTLTTEYLGQHAKKFVASCNKCFDSSVWPESDLKNMLLHLQQIEQLSNNKVQVKLDDETEKSIKQIQQIVNLYHEAVEVASVSTSFEGLSVARQKIAAARKYMNMKPISNCKQLMEQLRDVASRLEKAHYQYLVSQVEGMRNFQRTDYDQYTLSVGKKLEEYQKNARNIYGIESNVSSLYKKTSYYYDQYLAHY